MKKIVPKLGLQKLSDIQLFEFAEDKLKKTNGNPNFPTAFPERASVEALTEVFHKSILDSNEGGKNNTAYKNQVREDMEVLVKNFANACSTYAKGDEAIFLSSGFDIKKVREPIGKPMTPQGLQTSEGPKSGSIQLKWNPDYQVDVFHIALSEDQKNTDGWKDVGFSTRADFLVENLMPGKQYWFRIFAINAAGTSGNSDSASRFCS